MKLIFICGEKPLGKLTVIDMPRYDENSIYIPLWHIYSLAKRYNVNKKSVFWHILNHEIIHIRKGHTHYPYLDKIRSEQDFQKYANYLRKIELEAMPQPIDEEIHILNKAMKQQLEMDIKYLHHNFQKQSKTWKK